MNFIPLVIRFYLISILMFLSASIVLSISIFSSQRFKAIGKIVMLITVSSVFGVFILQRISPVSISSGQNNKYVIEITAVVLEDSRKISGGFSIFPVKVLYSGNLNLTTTSSTGKLTLASKIVVYKGQLLILKKVKFPAKNNSIIFVDKSNITMLDSNETWYVQILGKREEILKHTKSRINRMQKDVSILFTALFTGFKENPDSELFLSFRRAGASHILALSGMHLGIISLGIMFFLKYIAGRKISFLITCFTIIFYVFLTDAGTSLTRAAIFFVLLGFFILVGLKPDIFHVLVLCFIIQIIFDPESSYDLSFQLSYLALSGIILLGEKIKHRLPGIIPPWIRSVISASIAAQIFTAPLVLYQFGVIYPVGIFSGIILVPFVTVFIWIGIVSLLPFPWGIQNILFRIMDYIYRIIKISAEFFSQFPFLVLGSVLYIFIFFVCLYLIFRIVKYAVQTIKAN